MITLTAQAVVCPKLANTQSNKILCMNDFIKVNSKGVQPSVACFFLGYRQVTFLAYKQQNSSRLIGVNSQSALFLCSECLAVFNKRRTRAKSSIFYMFMSSYGMERFLGLLICRVFQRGRFLLGLMKLQPLIELCCPFFCVSFILLSVSSPPFFEHCIPIICKVNFLQVE